MIKIPRVTFNKVGKASTLIFTWGKLSFTRMKLSDGLLIAQLDAKKSLFLIKQRKGARIPLTYLSTAFKTKIKIKNIRVGVATKRVNTEFLTRSSSDKNIHGRKAISR